MNFNFSRKIISPLLTGLVSTLFIAGLSAPALADSKTTKEDKVVAGEIKAAEAKPVDAMSKAPADADFKKLDGNADGKLSLKEAVKDKALAAQFDATDANHDGMITSDEYATFKTASLIKSDSVVTPVTN